MIAACGGACSFGRQFWAQELLQTRSSGRIIEIPVIPEME